MPMDNVGPLHSSYSVSWQWLRRVGERVTTFILMHRSTAALNSSQLFCQTVPVGG